MRELTVAAAVAEALADFAVSRGARREALLARAGIGEEHLANPEGRVPFSAYVRLMKAGQHLCDDPALALHYGECVDATDVSIACLMGTTASSVADAFAQLNRYSRLAVEVEGVGDSGRFALERVGAGLWFVDRRANASDVLEITESTFARIACSSRRVAGTMSLFKELHVTHGAPAYADEYARIFAIPVRFGMTRNALLLDEALMSSFKPPRQSPYLSALLREKAEHLLAELDASRSTRGQVEQVLLSAMPTGNASVSAVASKLAVSRHTLFRKLREEGVTFESVLSELRRRMATHYLGEKQLSVSQTASLLGYSDPAAFSRAFKRWTGSSPRGLVNRGQ